MLPVMVYIMVKKRCNMEDKKKRHLNACLFITVYLKLCRMLVTMSVLGSCVL